MKKQILRISLLAIFALTVSIGAFAQGSDRTWSIGPEVGVNFSKLGRDADESDYNTGLLAGGFVTYSIRNTYAFTAKILYSQKGASGDGFFDGEDDDAKLHLNYIEIPVLARAFFNREGTVRPNVFLGPSFGFLTGAKGKIGDGDYESIDNYDDTFNSFDFGVAAGLGLNIKVGEEMYFIVDARYTYGFSDITVGSGNVNNQAVAVSAGLSFGIGN